jgi:hypothetical protein
MMAMTTLGVASKGRNTVFGSLRIYGTMLRATHHAREPPMSICDECFFATDLHCSNGTCMAILQTSPPPQTASGYRPYLRTASLKASTFSGCR